LAQGFITDMRYGKTSHYAINKGDIAKWVLNV